MLFKLKTTMMITMVMMTMVRRMTATMIMRMMLISMTMMNMPRLVTVTDGIQAGYTFLYLTYRLSG